MVRVTQSIVIHVVQFFVLNGSFFKSKIKCKITPKKLNVLFDKYKYKFQKCM